MTRSANANGAFSDLGAIDGPVLLFGGPYGNLQATHAVLAEAERRAIPPERVVCTGDLVAYCADPAATVDTIRRAGIQVVMGNCEEALAAGRADCGCGFEEGSACDLWSRHWFQHAIKNLDGDTRAWMDKLPHQIRFTLNGRRFAVIHGGGIDISRFVFASTSPADMRAEFAALDRDGTIDGVLAGHCGLPFSRVVDGRLWHNAGAVGLPANDGTPRTWFSTLAPRRGDIEVSHIPLRYDHMGAVRRMVEQGLPGAYARALADGLWPSMSVLPEPERRVRGVALPASILAWPTQHRRAA
jgi:predicted phosphodiesterase